MRLYLYVCAGALKCYGPGRREAQWFAGARQGVHVFEISHVCQVRMGILPKAAKATHIFQFWIWRREVPCQNSRVVFLRCSCLLSES